MYLTVGLQGQEMSFWPGLSGAPIVCMQGTNTSESPSASSTARPMRVMIFMLTTT